MRMAASVVFAVLLAGFLSTGTASACEWMQSVKTEQPVSTVMVPQTPAPPKTGG